MSKQPVERKRMMIENCDECGEKAPRLHNHHDHGFIKLLCGVCKALADNRGATENRPRLERGDCDHCNNEFPIEELWPISWDDIHHAMFWLCPICVHKLQMNRKERRRVRKEIQNKTRRAGNLVTPVQLCFPGDVGVEGDKVLDAEAEADHRLDSDTSSETHH